jgi:hypothetical protein
VTQEFSQDNQATGLDMTAMRAVWISKPSSDRECGSLILWLKTKEAADYLLQQGRAVFGVSGAIVTPYEWKEDTRPCFRCSVYGHKQLNCKKTPRCGYCSGAHWTRECGKDTSPKCPACGGEHPVWDRQYRVYPQRANRTSGQDQSIREPTGHQC